jgi:hypothetical protein
LPFTQNPGSGAYIFLFYILLGHIARLLNISNLLFFHITRVLMSLFFLVVLSKFCKKISFFTPGLETKIFALAVMGSGVGWLLLASGMIPSDLWVAEAYPFLSCYVNPHFPLGLALILLIFLGIKTSNKYLNAIFIALVSLLLSIVLPFGVVLVLVVLLALNIWNYLEKREISLTLLWVFIGGMPMIFYELWVIYSDPVFAAWNAQNITPTPGLLDLVFSFSPAFLLSIWGVKKSLQSSKNEPVRLMLAWFLTGLVIILLPVSIQRRFILGFFIPVSYMAIIGLEDLLANLKQKNKLLQPMFWGIIPISNIIVLCLGMFGIISHSPNYYLTQGEFKSIEWINQNTPGNSLILSSPEMGLYIPAQTGRRVLYGHPYETVNAVSEKNNVINFYKGTLSPVQMEDFLQNRKVDYLVLGPLEKHYGNITIPGNYPLVYSNNEVAIYQIHSN